MTSPPVHPGAVRGLSEEDTARLLEVMLLADEPNIRETIAFPLNQNAQDLLMGAPSEAEPSRLTEPHLGVRKPSVKDR